MSEYYKRGFLKALELIKSADVETPEIKEVIHVAKPLAAGLILSKGRGAAKLLGSLRSVGIAELKEELKK